MGLRDIVKSIMYAHNELNQLIKDDPFEVKKELSKVNNQKMVKRYINKCDKRIDKLFKKAKPWFEGITNTNVELKIKEGRITKQKVIRMYLNEHKE